MSVVDVHAHYLSEDLIDEFRKPEAQRLGVRVIRKGGGNVISVGDFVTNQPIPVKLAHTDARLAAMDEMGIDKQVLSPWMQLNGYNLSAKVGRDLSRAQNDSIDDLTRRYPDRFISAGTLPMQHVNLALDELDRISDLGFRAVQLGTHVRDTDLDDHSFDPLWSALAERGLLVLLHPFDPAGIDRMRKYLLELLVGFPSETTLAASKLLLSGIFDRHPGLRVCLPHGGGFLPYQVGRLDIGHKVSRTEPRANAAPTASIGQFYFDAITHSANALQFLIEVVGTDRVMLGTDYPFPLGTERPKDEINAVPSLSEADVDAICGGTASGLLDVTQVG